MIVKLKVDILFWISRKYIEHYIEHIPLETEKKALKVLGVCDRRNMAEQGEASG